MLYLFGKWFGDSWGPLRLLNSHLMLLSIGTMLGGLLVWSRLPRLWHLLPRDKCKVLAADGGSKAAGKHAGLMISLLLRRCPLVAHGCEHSGVVICLYLAMLFGYLDASAKPGRVEEGAA